MKPVILITGASRGIGRAVALAAAADYRVAVNYLGNESAAAAAVADIEDAGGEALAFQADAADPAEIDRLFSAVDAAFGRLDCLVNNAGVVAPAARVEDYDAARVSRILNLNILGPVLCAGHAVRRMSKHRGGDGGTIINISSIAARLGSPGEYVDYAASKAAIDTFTLGLAKEVADDGIRVNAVRPGLIDTDIHASGGQPDRLDRLTATIPMQRVGAPEEVAALVLFLASKAASYVTGSLIDVGGGR